MCTEEGFLDEEVIAFLFDRNATQKFPDFPDEDDGGSNAIFAKKSVDEVQAELDAVGFRFRIVSIHLSLLLLENGKQRRQRKGR